VYIHAKARRTGMGRALYHALFALLSLQGFYQGFAGITLPNPASVGLHEALGFQPVGVYHAVGYKLGGWHDVGWWQRAFQPRPSLPTPPTAFRGASADLDHVGDCAPRWNAVLTGVRSMCRVSWQYQMLSRQEEKTEWIPLPMMIFALLSVPDMA
jgi:phosphinothricin acetyltransferase